MKVLLIEDDQAIAATVQDYLNMKGIKVICSSTVKDAQIELKKSLPNVILCDIMLPDGTGYQILDRLMESNLILYTGFIFLSAMVEKSDRRRGIEAGADDYLEKPFEFKELISALYSVHEKVEIRKKEFNELKNELSDQAKIVSEIKCVNSHEIRGNLSRIQNLVHLVRKNVMTAEEGFDWILASCEKIDKAAHYLNDKLASASDVSPRDGKPLKIDYRLVWGIDDDLIQLTYFELAVNDLMKGTQVTTFSDPTVALKKLQSGEMPDLIFLDISMPEMSGFEFLEALEKEGYDVPVVMLSSSIDERDISKSLGHRNVINYQQKPLRPEVFSMI